MSSELHTLETDGRAGRDGRGLSRTRGVLEVELVAAELRVGHTGDLGARSAVVCARDSMKAYWSVRVVVGSLADELPVLKDNIASE